MKKTFCGQIAALTLFLISCSSGPKLDQTDPAAVKNEAIAEADAALPVVESPVLGTLPSLYERECAAKDSVSVLTRNSKLAEKASNGDEKARVRLEAIAEAWRTAYNDVQSYYTNLMQLELNKLAGKEIPLVYSTYDFSSAQAVITSRLNLNEISVDYEIVLARGVSLFEDCGMKFEYLDINGDVIGKASTTNKIWPDTYDNDGVNIVRAKAGAIWKASYRLYIPYAAEMAAIRVSINR